MSYYEWEDLYYAGLKEQKRLAKAREEGRQEAKDAIEKLKKIEHIVSCWDGFDSFHSMAEIDEVLSEKEKKD